MTEMSNFLEESRRRVDEIILKKLAFIEEAAEKDGRYKLSNLIGSFVKQENLDELNEEFKKHLYELEIEYPKPDFVSDGESTKAFIDLKDLRVIVRVLDQEIYNV